MSSLFSNLRLKEYTHIHTIYKTRHANFRENACVSFLSLCFLLFLLFLLVVVVGVCSKVVVVFLFLSLFLERILISLRREKLDKRRERF